MLEEFLAFQIFTIQVLQSQI